MTDKGNRPPSWVKGMLIAYTLGMGTLAAVLAVYAGIHTQREDTVIFSLLTGLFVLLYLWVEKQPIR